MSKEARDLFIAGLMQTLPPEDAPWEIEDRANWLRAAASVFALIYKDGNGRAIAVSVEGENKVEVKIDKEFLLGQFNIPT